MNYFSLIASLMLLSICVMNTAFANCIIPPDAPVKITVKSCENIDPKQTPKLKNYQGLTFGDKQKFLETFYRGALIVSREGGRFVYPSRKSNPCQQFKQGQVITKMVTGTCYDTGPWGRCIFGGVFLYDLGSKPINSFQ